MPITVTRQNVRELLEARRLWLKGDREVPIQIFPVRSELVLSHWELPFHGSRGRQTVCGAITDDWFLADGTVKPSYLLVDLEP